MDSVVKEALRKIVEEDGYKVYAEEQDAKELLKEMCKATEEATGVKAALISKMIKTLYKANFDEEKAKFEEFDELYQEIVG